MRHTKMAGVVWAGALLCLGALACGGSNSASNNTSNNPPDTTPKDGTAVPGDRASDAPPIKVGGKNFTEQFILARLIGQALEKNGGIKSELHDNLLTAPLWAKLLSGEVDVYVEYSGTLWTTQLKRKDVKPSEEVIAEVTRWFAAEHGGRVLGSLGFENGYRLALRKADAERLGITKLSELKAHAPKLRIAAEIEFFERDEWTKLQDVYGLKFKDKQKMPPNDLFDALKASKTDVIPAFSSDGRISANGLVVLEDDKVVFPTYFALILIGKSAAGRADVIKALEPLLGAISLETMQVANNAVDSKQATADDTARKLLGQVP